MHRLAINGYGRIGRCVLRALQESEHRDSLEIVAINEVADTETVVHLTRYDSTHGRFPGPVSSSDGTLQIGGGELALLREETISRQIGRAHV